jgi:hypothetical protein
MCVWNQCKVVNECTMLVQIYCYNKCGVVLEELNPHLPFGDHFLGIFFCIGQEQEGFLHFPLVYYR